MQQSEGQKIQLERQKVEIQRLGGLVADMDELRDQLDKSKDMNSDLREKIRKFAILETRLQSLNHDLALLSENEEFLKNKVSALLSSLK